MTPAPERLSLPAGIEDPRFSALLELLEQRISALPLATALVYRLSAVEEALFPALAWQWDIPSESWALAEPAGRRALVQQALRNQRRRGTLGAATRTLQSASGRVGRVRASESLYSDGTVYSDGTFLASEGLPGTYWIVVVGALPPLEMTNRWRLAVTEWMRATAHEHGVFSVDAAAELDDVSAYSSATSGGVPFNAAGLPGCVLALRGDIGLSVVDGYVTTWADQSGAANDAVVTRPGLNPLPASDGPWISPYGTEGLAAHGVAGAIGGDDVPFSAWFLARRSADLYSALCGAFANPDSELRTMAVLGQTAGRVQVVGAAAGDDAGFITPLDVWVTGEWAVCGVCVAGTSASLWINDTRVVTDAVFDSLPRIYDYFRVGALATTNGWGASAWRGDIAACLIYARDVSADAASIIDNLSAWAASVGITIGGA